MKPLKSYGDALELVALAALHMGGMNLPDAHALGTTTTFAAAVRDKATMQRLLREGRLQRIVTLGEAAAALKRARKAGFEYYPATARMSALWLFGHDDTALRPGIFVATKDDTFLKKVTRSLTVITAVTGTRAMTPYGEAATRSAVAALSADTGVLATGFTYGVQKAAIEAALESGLPVAVILACGPGDVYPAGMRDLYQRIIDTPGCAVATPFFPDTMPEAMNFIVKNHYLARAVRMIIPESAVKGGAMVAARLAGGNGAAVCAVPGRLTDAKSAGCNQLIREGTARIYTYPEDAALS